MAREGKKDDGAGSSDRRIEIELSGALSSMTMLEGIMKFSGEDKTHSSTKWAQDIEDNAEIFGWTEAQKLVIARRTIVGTAALWLQSEKTFKKYEELKTAILKEFCDSANSKEMHEMMASRKKRKDESFYQFMLSMKELGKRAKFPDYVSIQYIIDGIEDYEPNKAILYGATTYPVLKEKLALYEKLRLKSKPVHNYNTHHFTPGVKKEEKRKRCYKCGEDDHLSVTCTKGVKCFRCNEYGHIGRQCPNQTASGSGTSSPTTANKTSKYAGITEVKKEEDNDWNLTTSTSNNSISMKENLQLACNNNIITTNKPTKNVFISGRSAVSLIDSGSEVNLMCEDFKNAISAKTCDDRFVFSGLGLIKVCSLGQLFTNITIDNKVYNDVIFHVVPKGTMPYDVIIGQEFLKNVVMIMNGGSITLLEPEWMSRMNCFAVGNDFVIGHIKDEKVKMEVMQCVTNYKPVQTREAPIELKIVLKDDVPVAQRPRRISLKEQQVVERQMEEWLAAGIIRVSYSEYSSPLVLVQKKDGTTRVCVDYRLLNKKLVKDEFPLPIIEDLIDKLSHAQVFSVLDLKNGFFHLKVSPESVKYTSFVTNQAQYEFLRAPFGLSICPKIFMRFVTIIFRELIMEGVMSIFIDDIVIPAQDEREAVERLKRVLEVASSYGLQINWKKAKLVCREIEYLGHNIQAGEVRPSSEKTEAVLRYPEPRTIKQLHSFVGLTSYFRKYIPNFATIAQPLTDLIKKDADFVFNDEQKNAFEILKEKMATGPVLKIFNPDLNTELHCDASSKAIAAILMQYHPDTGLHPVHYMSKKMNEAQSKYSSYELEALAVVEGVKKFHHYLFGINFKIITDCQALELTLKKKDLTAKVARWVMALIPYTYKMEHRAGTGMRHVDALSRNPYVGAIQNSLHEQLKLAQDRDDGLKAIKAVLAEGPYQDYWLENGILYKGDQKQVVVPRAMEREVIERIHCQGHFAMRKMKEAVSKDFYIRNIDRRIEEVMTSCIPCLLATRKEGKQEGYLNPIEKEANPLHTLHLDHVGPLTETRKLYNHILTMVDAFTKFVWLFPTKSTTAAEVISKLQVHQQVFGNPSRIITDRGTAFTSEAFRKYCEGEGIQHITITTGLPRGNGQVERIHRIIIPMLTKLCIEDPAVWYKNIGRVQRALNSTYQRSIGTSPFQLLMGTRMRNKDDLEVVRLLEQETAKQYDEAREDLRHNAKLQILKIQEENKKNYDRGRKQSKKYNVGDLVAIKRTQFGPGLKLKPKFLGPYRVTNVKRNDRYDVEKLSQDTEGPGKTSTSADHMKQWPMAEEDDVIGE